MFQIYPLFNERKGRACIISIPEFQDPYTLRPLVGYNDDKTALTKLWKGLGFAVYSPEIKDDRDGLWAEVKYK